ncbi:ogr/Delta-like zinc finger family protein [Klebsiella variicola]|uniref:ogr/Delta-like zinc finger family protein n=1 Tax=Klebsiella variicola TaxID=244366 RepID=UPI0015D4FB8A|nr:ogr/Delta-like zinc finger family protein [Klebsiella variicola]EIX9043011.1 ogr/Delta-like zinc finger family protein [Klebsiella variicola]
MCPLCGSAAHTRSGFQVSSMTKERYNQCQNINCNHTFVTYETFVRSISTPKEAHPV